MKKNVVVIALFVFIGLIILNYRFINSGEITVSKVLLDNFCNTKFTVTNRTDQNITSDLKINLFESPSTGNAGGLLKSKLITVSLQPEEVKIIEENLNCPPGYSPTIAEVEIVSVVKN